MRMNKLGRTGPFVSELCLGTITFGGGEGMWQHIGALDQANSERLVGRSIDAMRPMAEQRGVSVAQIALASLLPAR